MHTLTLAALVLAMLTSGCAIYRKEPVLNPALVSVGDRQAQLEVDTLDGALVFWPFFDIPSGRQERYLITYKITGGRPEALAISAKQLERPGSISEDYAVTRTVPYDTKDIAAHERVNVAFTYLPTDMTRLRQFAQDAKQSPQGWSILLKDYPVAETWMLLRITTGGFTQSNLEMNSVDAATYLGWEEGSDELVFGTYSQDALLFCDYSSNHIKWQKVALHYEYLFKLDDGMAKITDELRRLLEIK